MKPQLLLVSLSILSLGSSKAAITALTPDSVTASTFFGNLPQFAPEALYDGDTNVLTVGTNNGLGSDYAGQGSVPHTVVFDFGSSYNFTDAFYAQRGNFNLDAAGSIRVWFLDTDPGVATTSLAGTLGTPDTTITPSLTGAQLEQYTVSGTGRYIVAEIIDHPTQGTANPGGFEFRFNGAVVPEPSTVALLSLAGFGLLRRKR